MNPKFKEMLLNLLQEGAKELFTHVMSQKESDPEEDKEKVKKELEELKKKKVPNEEPSVVEITEQARANGHIIPVTKNLTLVRNAKVTTFCNEADFVKPTYALATNSQYDLFYKGQMKDKRGISLSFPIDKNLIVYPMNPNNGVMFGYKQVDVGPGYEKDYWLREKRLPKNVSGFDQWGRASAKAWLDVLPQVWEDLGLADFDEAYSKGVSMDLDFLVYQPDTSGGNEGKTSGHDVPSKDTRPWVANLPDTGSQYFPWNELLRGWKVSSAPNPEMVNNMLLLVKTLLLPAREALGRLKVTNGFRDMSTNKAVGGREGSLHLSGRAVDIVPLDTSFEKAYEWMKANLSGKVRELLWEYPNDNNEHIHLGGPILKGESPNIRIKR